MFTACSRFYSKNNNTNIVQTPIIITLRKCHRENIRIVTVRHNETFPNADVIVFRTIIIVGEPVFKRTEADSTRRDGMSSDPRAILLRGNSLLRDENDWLQRYNRFRLKISTVLITVIK